MGSAGKRYERLSLLTAVSARNSTGLVTVMFAPGSTAPLVSVTLP
jgi:hypothetical protein